MTPETIVDKNLVDSKLSKWYIMGLDTTAINTDKGNCELYV